MIWSKWNKAQQNNVHFMRCSHCRYHSTLIKILFKFLKLQGSAALLSVSMYSSWFHCWSLCHLVALQEDWQLQLQNKLQWIKYYWNNINVTPGTKVMIGVHKSSLLPPMSEFNFPYCMMIMTCNVLWCAFVRWTQPYLCCHHCFYRSVHKLFGDMCPKRDEHFRSCAYMELVKLLFLINFYLKISLNKSYFFLLCWNTDIAHVSK